MFLLPFSPPPARHQQGQWALSSRFAEVTCLREHIPVPVRVPSQGRALFISALPSFPSSSYATQEHLAFAEMTK